MTRPNGFLLLASCCVMACSDSSAPPTTPPSVAGHYVYTTLGDSSGNHPAPSLAPYPSAAFIADSLRDEIQLQSDMTYTETGLLAGTDANASSGPTTHLVDLTASGTYAVDGNFITLHPTTGLTISTWTGLIANGTMVLVRYPGSWTLTRTN